MIFDTKQSESGNAFSTILLIILGVIIIGLLYFLSNAPTSKNKPNTNVPRASENFKPNDGGMDGLGGADTVSTYKLDEFGTGISSVSVFNHDINGDGQMDRITRTHHETGNAHPYDEYKIELNKNGKMVDITPSGMRTVVGTECTLQTIQFVLRPKFEIIKISRPWSETWDTPTMAQKTVYSLNDDTLNATGKQDLGIVCDVMTLI